VLKGPTRLFCEHAGIDPTAQGLLGAYPGLLDGMVADEAVEGIPALVTDTLMQSSTARRRVAAQTLDFAASLRG